MAAMLPAGPRPAPARRRTGRRPDVIETVLVTLDVEVACTVCGAAVFSFDRLRSINGLDADTVLRPSEAHRPAGFQLFPCAHHVTAITAVKDRHP